MITLVLLAGVIAGAVWFRRHRHGAVQQATETIVPIIAPVTNKPVAPATTVTNAPAAPANPAPPAAATRSKSPDDLKVGVIQLEKTKGSSLVYAVGMVKNDSEFDRYGIRIQLDIFNNAGTKIAAAKDYKDYLAPHQDWRFHALIPDSKAASAKVASLKEDQ